MKKIFSISFLLAALFSLPVVSASGQELMVPDDDHIFNRITDNESPFFYPVLYARFQSGDMELTVEDYHYLYYGFAFSERYSPSDPIPEETNILMILDAHNGNPDENAMYDIIYNGLMVMETDPFSPANLNFLTFAYGAVRDTLNEKLSHDRLTKVLEVIGLSGDGSFELPVHVLRFSHATDWMASKGLQPGARRVVSRNIEFIALPKRDGDIWGYYFDFSRIYRNRSADENRRPGWQINDVPIGRARNNR